MISRVIKHFRRSPKFLGRFGLVKYFQLPLLNLLRGSKTHLSSQFDLLSQLMQEDFFTLIILDACRYDAFKAIYKQYLDGDLLKVRSLGLDTDSFLSRLVNLQEFQNIRVFSSNPHMRKTSEIEIIDLWKNCWDEERGTVLPEKVNQSVIRHGLANRNILWYMPPHFPWIEDVNFSREVLNEMINRDLPLAEILNRKIKDGETSKDEIRQLYLSNLRLSLLQISNLLEIIRDDTDQIAITSDHGELLGEYKLFSHYRDLNAPELYTVPWLDITS